MVDYCPPHTRFVVVSGPRQIRIVTAAGGTCEVSGDRSCVVEAKEVSAAACVNI